MSKLTFLQPVMLWFLAGVPVYFLLRWWDGRRQQRAMARFSDVGIFKMLNPTLQVVGRHAWLRLLLLFGAVLFLVLSLARPGGDPVFVEEEVTQKGLEIMLLIDLSSSMRATDLTPNRMEATKEAVKFFVNQISNDRVGLVVFAGSVALQSPMTQDYRTAKMMIDIVSTNFLPVDGTAIGDALKYALERIGKENRKNAVIILLTDGENTKGKAPLEVLPEITEAGTRIYAIGVGTPEGTMIPDGEDENGKPKYKMYMGQPVITKLDEPLLERLAKDTGGKYYSAATNDSLMRAYEDISRLTKTEHTEKKKKPIYKEFYVWTALTALLLLLVESFMGRRTAWLPSLKRGG
ncbi:VWA domain-containing protein [candidate division FCPU426 bacterium]|nr:VWA domain-containing protein [candidate division FCPU426 bacterium]